MTDADAEFEWSYTDPETGETATSDDQYETHCKLSARLLRREHHAQQLHPATHLTATAPAPRPAPTPHPMCSSKPAARRNAAPLRANSSSTCCRSHTRTPASSTPPSTTDNRRPALPVFGYNVNSDTYWTNYSLNGETQRKRLLSPQKPLPASSSPPPLRW